MSARPGPITRAEVAPRRVDIIDNAVQPLASDEARNITGWPPPVDAGGAIT